MISSGVKGKKGTITQRMKVQGNGTGRLPSTKKENEAQSQVFINLKGKTCQDHQ